MINVQIPRTIGSNRTQAPVWRPSSQVFWVLLALQALVIVVILAGVLNSLPSGLPLSQADTPLRVRDFVLAGDRAADPLIEVVPGVLQRSSSLRGLQFQDQTYYYYYEGRSNYDPLSRGAVTADQVELLLRDTEGGTPLVIYRVIAR